MIPTSRGRGEERGRQKKKKNTLIKENISCFLQSVEVKIQVQMRAVNVVFGGRGGVKYWERHQGEHLEAPTFLHHSSAAN